MIKVYCDKCGKEIKEFNPLWEIKQTGAYGSQYDGEYVKKQFCDKCLSEFIELDSG